MEINLDTALVGEIVNVLYKGEIVASFEKADEEALVLLHRLKEDNPFMKLTWSESSLVELKIY